jgi:hypothetical protein
MVAKAGDPGFVDGRTSLVKIAPGRLPAMITAKKPIAGKRVNMANWVVHNAAPHGVLANDYFYKYLEHAEGADLRGTPLWRKFTIEDVGSGWWRQIPVNGGTSTVIPDHLRFTGRLPDNGQGA